MGTQHFNRRHMLRMIGAAAVVAVPALGVAQSASAGRAWCRVDPLFTIDGYHFDIALSADEAMLASASGLRQITLRIPKGSVAELIFQDQGFGYGYTYKIIDDRRQSSIQNFSSVGVEVVAPAKDSTIPMGVTLMSIDKTATMANTTTVYGTANSTVSWYGKVAKVDQTDASKLLATS